MFTLLRAVKALAVVWSDSDPRGLHAAQLVLELLDLVADAGGDLELQLRRCGVHLLGELGDQADEVAPGHALAAGLTCAGGRKPGAGRHPWHRRLPPALLPAAASEQLLGVGVLADQLVEDVGDPLAQRG